MQAFKVTRLLRGLIDQDLACLLRYDSSCVFMKIMWKLLSAHANITNRT